MEQAPVAKVGLQAAWTMEVLGFGAKQRELVEMAANLAGWEGFMDELGI